VDPRPTGAMALGAPTLAGLAATMSIARRHNGAENYRWQGARGRNAGGASGVAPLDIALEGRRRDRASGHGASRQPATEPVRSARAPVKARRLGDDV
jgi:hypothetical protein